MAYLVVLAAVLTRFAPHPGNFTPVFAALLFAGAYLKKRDSLWFPVVLLAASDVVLTTRVYHMSFGWGDTLEWIAFAAVVLVGWWLRGRISVARVLAASLAGPTVFFFISNFTVWLGWRMYSPTWQGLMDCYVAGLPFFRNSLLSGLLYSALLFGAYELYRRKVARKEPSASGAPLA